MSRNPNPNDRPATLPLAELFTRYLGRQAEAQALGLGHTELAGDVEPYEAVPVQPMEPRLAWNDAVAVAVHFSEAKAEWPVPPEWPALVAAQEPAVAVPFCLGNFPQLVRDLQPLFAGRAPAVPAKPARPLPAGGLTAWAERQKSYPPALLAAGVLRLAQHFDSAVAALGKPEAVPAAWRAVHANEVAALAWHRGQHAEALAQWEAQPASVPVLFNRGMALLFLGRSENAREPLSQAVAGLKETNAWHHLGQLYLTLAKANS
jgi:hypothetical protein